MNEIILQALMDRLNTLTNKPPIAWPNVSFTPPASGPWLQVNFFPGETQNRSLGNTDPALHLGIFQVSVYYRPNTGVIDPAKMADAVIWHFAKGTRLHQSGKTVSVQRKPWAAPPVQDDDKFFIPVSIPYRSVA